jgi:hypothetical protein
LNILNDVPLTKLKTINLSRNKLIQLGIMKVPFESLETLDLSENPLLADLDGQFEGLKCLKRLYMRFCDIKFISKGYLNGLLHLIELDLNHNKLSVIEIGAFDSLDRLLKLKLYDNNVIVKRGIFKRLESLSLLEISLNTLGSCYEDLIELSHLKELSVAVNEATTMDEEFASAGAEYANATTSYGNLRSLLRTLMNPRSNTTNEYSNQSLIKCK